MFDVLRELDFAWPWLFALLLVPLFIYALVPRAVPQGGALKVPFYRSLTDRRAVIKRRPGWLVPTCMGLIWGLLVVAAARPQWLDEASGVPVSGRDLMMAVDVSGSMKTRDMQFRNRPENRLGTVKRVAGEFIARRAGDRIGLILFGTRAYLQAPLSLDRNTVDQLLQEAAIGIAGEKTAIGDAIGLAMKRLSQRPGDERLLILLTDGTNTAGEMEPLQAAELARLGGLRIHTIGVGAERTRNQSVFGSSFFGQRSELDERSLKQIAEMTGGRYFRATDGERLSEIYALIDTLEPVEDSVEHLRPRRELYWYPLAGAVILSLLLGCVLMFGSALIGRIAARGTSPMAAEARP